MAVLKKIGRELNRPFKRLFNGVKAKFQRAVLKTIERNAGHVQSIVGNSSTTYGTPGIGTNANMDALLLAFIRSSQRNRRPRTTFPHLALAETNDEVALASFSSSQDLLVRAEVLANLLLNDQQQAVVLRVYDNSEPDVIHDMCAKFISTHQSQLYVSHQSDQNACVCLFERKAA